MKPVILSWLRCMALVTTVVVSPACGSGSAVDASDSVVDANQGIDASSVPKPARVVAELEGWVPDVTVDDTTVYGTFGIFGPDGWAGSVWSVPVAGGDVATLTTSMFTALAVDATHLYCIDLGSGEGVPDAIVKMPKTGGTPGALVRELTSEAASYLTLALDETRVWWVTGQDVSGHGTVRYISKLGGTPTILAENLLGPNDISVAGDGAFWIDRGPATDAIGTVMYLPVEGGTPTVLAGSVDIGEWSRLAADSASVYWTTKHGRSESGMVMKVPRAGGIPTAIVGDLDPDRDGRDVMIDGNYFYWFTNRDAVPGTNRILRVPKNGGEPVVLYETTWSIGGMAQSETHLVWREAVSDGTFAGTRVMAMEK